MYSNTMNSGDTRAQRRAREKNRLAMRAWETKKRFYDTAVNALNDFVKKEWFQNEAPKMEDISDALYAIHTLLSKHEISEIRKAYGKTPKEVSEATKKLGATTGSASRRLSALSAGSSVELKPMLHMIHLLTSYAKRVKFGFDNVILDEDEKEKWLVYKNIEHQDIAELQEAGRKHLDADLNPSPVPYKFERLNWTLTNETNEPTRVMNNKLYIREIKKMWKKSESAYKRKWMIKIQDIKRGPNKNKTKKKKKTTKAKKESSTTESKLDGESNETKRDDRDDETKAGDDDEEESKKQELEDEDEDMKSYDFFSVDDGEKSEAIKQRALEAIGIGALRFYLRDDVTKRELFAENKLKSELMDARENDQRMLEKNKDKKVRVPTMTDMAIINGVGVGQKGSTFKKSQKFRAKGPSKFFKPFDGGRLLEKVGGGDPYLHVNSVNAKINAVIPFIERGVYLKEWQMDPDIQRRTELMDIWREALRLLEIQNFTGNQVAETRFETWYYHKDLAERARNCLKGIMSPAEQWNVYETSRQSLISEGDSVSSMQREDKRMTKQIHERFMMVGKALKAVSAELLFKDWVAWSKGYKSSGFCERKWSEFPPYYIGHRPKAMKARFLKLFANKCRLEGYTLIDLNNMMMNQERQAKAAAKKARIRNKSKIGINRRNFFALLKDLGISDKIVFNQVISASTNSAHSGSSHGTTNDHGEQNNDEDIESKQYSSNEPNMENKTANYEKIFRLFDANGDGVISIEEFKECIGIHEDANIETAGAFIRGEIEVQLYEQWEDEERENGVDFLEQWQKQDSGNLRKTSRALESKTNDDPVALKARKPALPYLAVMYDHKRDRGMRAKESATFFSTSIRLCWAKGTKTLSTSGKHNGSTGSIRLSSSTGKKLSSSGHSLRGSSSGRLRNSASGTRSSMGKSGGLRNSLGKSGGGTTRNSSSGMHDKHSVKEEEAAYHDWERRVLGDYKKAKFSSGHRSNTSEVTKFRLEFGGQLTGRSIKEYTLIGEYPAYGQTREFDGEDDDDSSSKSAILKTMSCVKSGLKPNTTYGFRLIAINGEGLSSTPVYRNFTTLPPRPAAPYVAPEGKAVMQGKATLTLSWGPLGEYTRRTNDLLKNFLRLADEDRPLSSILPRERPEITINRALYKDWKRDAKGFLAWAQDFSPKFNFDTDLEAEIRDDGELDLDELFQFFKQQKRFFKAAQEKSQTAGTKYVLVRKVDVNERDNVSSSLRTTQTRHGLWQEIFEGTKLSTTVTGLEPGQRYVFRVYAKNRAGNPSLISEKTEVYTMLSQPLLPMLDTKSDSTGGKSFVGQTQMPNVDDHQKTIMGKEIRKQMAREALDIENQRVKIVNGVGPLGFKVKFDVPKKIRETWENYRVKHGQINDDDNDVLVYECRWDSGIAGQGSRKVVKSGNTVASTLASTISASTDSTTTTTTWSKAYPVGMQSAFILGASLYSNAKSRIMTGKENESNANTSSSSGRRSKMKNYSMDRTADINGLLQREANLKPNTCYRVQIRRRLDDPYIDVISPWSPVLKIQTRPYTPQQPRLVSHSIIGTGKKKKKDLIIGNHTDQYNVIIRWWPGERGAHKYIVYQECAGAAEVEAKTGGLDFPSSESYVSKHPESFAPGKSFGKKIVETKEWVAEIPVEMSGGKRRYRFRVVAVNKDGLASAVSNPLDIDHLESPPRLTWSNSSDHFVVPVDRWDIVSGDSLLFTEIVMEKGCKVTRHVAATVKKVKGYGRDMVLELEVLFTKCVPSDEARERRRIEAKSQRKSSKLTSASKTKDPQDLQKHFVISRKAGNIFIEGFIKLSIKTMLQAERAALDADLHARRLDIKEKDLNMLTVFLDGLATQSALLAGFAFGGLGQIDKTTDPGLEGFLYLSTIFSLIFNFYVLCVGQLTTILGPTLALNGPHGSLERAVVEMRKERWIIFASFILGLISFYFMVIALCFIHMKIPIAITCAVLATIAALIIAYRCVLKFNSFHFVEPLLHKFVETRIDQAEDQTRDQRSFDATSDSTGGSLNTANNRGLHGIIHLQGGKMPATEFLNTIDAQKVYKMKTNQDADDL
eukprot:g3720.t1